MRAAESDITLDSNGNVTGKSVVSSILYTYDKENKLTKKRILPASGSEQVIYYEHSDAESQATVVKFTAGGKDITSHSKTDSFGRKEFDELQLGTGFVSRQFRYVAGLESEEHIDNGKLKSSPTTQLVSQIVLSDGRTLDYEYDAEERITKVTDSVDGVIEYTYDAQGQLLTETNDGVAVNTMTYDGYGNILTKNGKTYTYGDSVWKDLLTSYDGQSIAYDAQGNPTSYLGHTLTWEKGRQLKSFDSNTYTYNANGIRTSKTVNGVKHTYTLDGTKILRETWGIHTLAPLYDNEDSVCGIIYNSTPYYFFKNQQGDIIAITDQNGDVIAKYSYDAWGLCTITQDSSTVGIANINPFRYRGYYFDSEIGMYYLQSRYYNPVVGRFVNADEPECVMLSLNAVRHDLFAYCNNNPINYTDATGHIALADDALYLLLLGLCSVLLPLIILMSMPEFQRSWSAFCATVGNGLSWIWGGIVNAGRAIWSWAKGLVKSAAMAVASFLIIARADAQIKSKVKRNSRQRYWIATIFNLQGYTFVSISSAINYSVAKNRVKAGLCVFTVTRTEARQLASNFPPVVGPERGGKTIGQYMHYHVYNRRSSAHIFFLF